MECRQCGKEFTAKRSTARYCSAKCRVLANRLSVTTGGRSVTLTELSVTKSVTLTPVDVTLTEWQQQLKDLPFGVVRPTCKQDPLDVDPNDKHEDEDWDGRWQSSVEYMETIWRLIHYTVAELRQAGQWIPVWKYAREAA